MTDYYVVASGGSNANNGLSLATAFATIAFASTIAGPGDTIWVGSGNYTGGFATSKSGTTGGGRLRYQAITKYGAVILGMSGAVAYQWNNSGSYVDIDGFEFDGQGSVGNVLTTGLLNSGAHTRFSNLKIHDILTNATTSATADAGAGGAGIKNYDATFAAVDADVERCLVYNIGDLAIPRNTGNIQGIQLFTPGSAVYNCVVHHVLGDGINTGLRAKTQDIRHNTIYSVGGSDILIRSDGSDSTAGDLFTVANNILCNPGGSPVIFADSFESGSFGGWSWVQGQDTSQGGPGAAYCYVSTPAALGVPQLGNKQYVAHFESPTSLPAQEMAKIYKEWSSVGKTDQFGRTMDALPNPTGEYSCWYYFQSSFLQSGNWANIFQWKENGFISGVYHQDPSWWLNITVASDVGGSGNTPTIFVNHWNQDYPNFHPVTRALPLGRWFNITAFLYQGNRIDFYIDGTLFDTALHATYPVGTFFTTQPSGVSNGWVFGIGHYGGFGVLYADGASVKPLPTTPPANAPSKIATPVPGSSGAGIKEYGTVGTGNVISNNHYFSAAYWNQSGHTESGALTSDPVFVNAGSLDFHLQTSSPAKDSAASGYQLPVDFDGAYRPVGSVADRGAFEYGGVIGGGTKLRHSRRQR